MKYFTTIIFLTLSGFVYANEVADSFLKEVAKKAEQRAEFAVNDIFNNIEIDLSGFNQGKPSYEINTILPLHDGNNRNTFFQGHFSTQAEIEMLNIGIVQRQSILKDKIIIGYNIFYDLDLDNSHERSGIGADLLTSLGDIHLNYYDAITNSVVVNGLSEYTLDGFDAQIAFPLPYLPKSKLYAEAFSWNGINSSRDLEGETYSLKNELPYGMMLEFGKTSYDHMSRDQEFINLTINLLEFKKNKNSLSSELSKMYSSVPYELYSFSDVSNRKYERVRRENKIIKQSNRTGTVKIVGY